MKPAPPVTSARMAAHRSGRLLDCAGWAGPIPPTLAFATCAAQPRDWDDDDHLVALTGATWHDWDDPAVDWDAFDLVVVRSTWDYPARLRRVPPLGALGPPPRQPAARCWSGTPTSATWPRRARAGLPIVPTRFVVPGEPWGSPPAARFVVKPAVSVGAQDTLVLRARRGRPRGGPRGVDPRLRAHRDGPAARRVGGRARRAGALLLRRRLLARDRQGRGARARRRRPARPRDAPGGVAGRRRRRTSSAWPSAPWRGWASASARCPPTRGSTSCSATTSEPQLLELELTEPCLFFRHAPDGAEERFAAVLVAARCGRPDAATPARAPRHVTVVDRAQPRGDLRRRARDPDAAQAVLAGGRVAPAAARGGGQGDRVARRDDALEAHELRQRADRAGHDGHAGGHRLGGGQPEGLRAARGDERDGGPRAQRGERRRRRRGR